MTTIFELALAASFSVASMPFHSSNCELLLLHFPFRRVQMSTAFRPACSEVTSLVGHVRV